MASKPAKVATLQFQCDPTWRRKVKSIASLRGESLSSVCVAAVSKYLKLEQKGEAA